MRTESDPQHHQPAPGYLLYWSTVLKLARPLTFLYNERQAPSGPISLDFFAERIVHQGERVSKPEPSVTSGENGNATVSLEQSNQLLRTKLYIPSIRPNQIARPRLSSLLDGSLDRPLILVSAPAGYGKTTLVSSWVKDKGIPSAWLSLDDSDNDPVRFIQYLFAALLPFAQNIENDLPGMLQGIQPAQFENVITLLANELASFSNPFVLILDDFHVIHSEAVLRILTHLLDHLPPRMHLVILTRVDPPLPLSRLRVRNQLLDIRADQLRFTQDEIAAFLNEAMGLTLSAGDLSAMEARTEGWIAGLQLAALSMQGSKDIHGFVSAFTGSHHYVMDYLVEEVLKQQPEKCEFLPAADLDPGSLMRLIVRGRRRGGWHRHCRWANDAGNPGRNESLRHPAGR